MNDFTPEDILRQIENTAMSIDWSKIRFADLETDYKRGARLSLPLDVRYGSIMEYVESDRIMPPIARAKARIIPALKEVLARLPEDDFDLVEDRVGIIVQDEAVLALNVPPWDVEHNDVYTLVLFDPCWKLSFDALVGLIAHELAHTWVEVGDDQSDEAATNAKVRSWGFDRELACLDSEKQRIF